MISWRTFIFSQVGTNSLLPGSNSTWYLLLSNGYNPSITFLGNSTPPWYVIINNSMHCVWRICFLSTDQMDNKALWTSFPFKHGSWCVSFTWLSFSSCNMTSQTVEEKTLTNKLSLVPFFFFIFPSFCSLYYFFFYSFFYCSLLQPLILTDLSWCHKFLLLPKEYDKSPWVKYHIILLSRIAMYWIWCMLDPDERLLVTRVSPPIFGSQHCFRFRNRMQLSMDDLRLNTLYNKLAFLFQI